MGKTWIPFSSSSLFRIVYRVKSIYFAVRLKGQKNLGVHVTFGIAFIDKDLEIIRACHE